MALRLFIFSHGDEVAAVAADHVPRVGDTLWVKTLEGEWNLLVQEVEHQLDRGTSASYGNHDVCLYCVTKPEKT